VATTNQENLLETLDDLPHHLPHLGHQFKDAKGAKTPQHHQQLSPRLRRHVRRQPTQEDQTTLEERKKGRERGSDRERKMMERMKKGEGERGRRRKRERDGMEGGRSLETQVLT
jgi:hypothetical protein